MKQASTPEGAGKLDETLAGDDFDGGMLDGLSDMLGGGGDTGAMSNMGGGLINMIFGEKAGAIAEIIGRLTGMKSGSTTSLLALLAPLVMSFLGKQKRSLGLDSGGLANLLMSQKDEVAKSMPGGIAGTLGLTDLGFQDTPAGVPASTPTAAPQPAVTQPAATQPAATQTSAAEPSPSGGGIGKMLIPLIVAGVLGLLGFQFLGGNAVKDAVDQKAGDALGMSADDVTGKLNDVFGGYQETLSGITDVESANEAVPEMESLNEKLGGISSMLDKLPAGIQETVTGQLSSMVDPIKAMIDKVMAMPGVEPILKPLVDSMLEKVSMISEA
jgi:hypothetical protein